MPIIPALGKLRQECEFEASCDCVMRPFPKSNAGLVNFLSSGRRSPRRKNIPLRRWDSSEVRKIKCILREVRGNEKMRKPCLFKGN